MKFVYGWAFPDADEFMAKEIKEDGTYQGSHVLRAIEICKRRGKLNVAVDGGAHVGTWTKLLSAEFKHVHAFEPSPDTFECLQYNMRDISNLTLHNQALGERRDMVSMTLAGDEKSIANKNTGARYAVLGGNIISDRIDVLALAGVDFLKLDIEGYELYALRGAAETLMRCKPIVLFEDKGHWKRFGIPRRAPHEFLQSLGAHHIERVGADEIWGWK